MPDKKTTVKIIRGCIVAGAPVHAGKKVSVSINDARIMINAGRAELATGHADASGGKKTGT